MAYDDEGQKVAEYKWIRVPRDDEALAPVPESVVEFLRAIDRVSYVSGSSAPLAQAVRSVPTVPTATRPAAPPPAAPTTTTVAARNAELMAQAMRAELTGYYRKLHADDYNSPNDERLAAMWLLTGSLLCRENEHKKGGARSAGHTE